MGTNETQLGVRKSWTSRQVVQKLLQTKHAELRVNPYKTFQNVNTTCMQTVITRVFPPGQNPKWGRFFINFSPPPCGGCGVVQILAHTENYNAVVWRSEHEKSRWLCFSIAGKHHLTSGGSFPTCKSIPPWGRSKNPGVSLIFTKTRG